jgi:hypothetical protein
MRRALRSGALVPGEDAITGGPSFGEWLHATAQPRRHAGECRGVS